MLLDLPPATGDGLRDMAIGHSTNGSLGVTMHTIARSAGGRSSAASHWMRPP